MMGEICYFCCRFSRTAETKKPSKINGLFLNSGGSGEIRTHERLTPSAVFKTPAYALQIKPLARNRFRRWGNFDVSKSLFILVCRHSCGIDFRGQNRCGRITSAHEGAMNSEIYDDLDELPAAPRVDIPDADLELLKRAARAIGAVRVEVVDGEGYVNLHFADGSVVHSWNPLMFSGDAFELAATLELDVMHRVVSGKRVEILPAGGPLTKHFYEGDVVAATRHAVVLSAAEIGKLLK